MSTLQTTTDTLNILSALRKVYFASGASKRGSFQLFYVHLTYFITNNRANSLLMKALGGASSGNQVPVKCKYKQHNRKDLQYGPNVLLQAQILPLDPNVNQSEHAENHCNYRQPDKFIPIGQLVFLH